MSSSSTLHNPHITIIGNPLKASAMSAIAGRIADSGANIDKIERMARYPVTDTLTISANVNNLLDESYNRSLWGYADYGAPRNFSVKARWMF